MRRCPGMSTRSTPQRWARKHSGSRGRSRTGCTPLLARLPKWVRAGAKRTPGAWNSLPRCCCRAPSTSRSTPTSMRARPSSPTAAGARSSTSQARWKGNSLRPMRIPLSILDLATVGRNETVAESLQGSVKLAQLAEACGYHRVWYAEHHNMASIASSATSVLIAHVAAHTSSIRPGSGGVMLPNHPPLIIAEHYGTLAELHPGRIDLGLGRAPGTDPKTMLALRRDHTAADTFPHDVLELQGYLRGQSRIPGVEAYPGKGTDVPLYILGSSLFGAKLAAQLGLPYAFASHFAPAALHQALEAYRSEFTPSEQLSEPYAIAALNVIAADTREEAETQRQRVLRSRVRLFVPGGSRLTAEEADMILASPQGQQISSMLTYTAMGTQEEVKAYLADFARSTGADALIVAHQGAGMAARLRAIEITAAAWGLTAR